MTMYKIVVSQDQLDKIECALHHYSFEESEHRDRCDVTSPAYSIFEDSVEKINETINSIHLQCYENY